MDQFLYPREQNSIGVYCEQYINSADYGKNPESDIHVFCCVQVDLCSWYNQPWFLPTVFFGSIALALCFITVCCVFIRCLSKRHDKFIDEQSEREDQNYEKARKKYIELKRQKMLAKIQKKEGAKAPEVPRMPELKIDSDASDNELSTGTSSANGTTLKTEKSENPGTSKKDSVV